MKSIRLIVLVLSAFLATSSAYASLQQQRDTAPPDPCGPVESPCYVGGSGTACSTPVYSYETCLDRCNCKYQANVKACDGNQSCLDSAASEKNACFDACTGW